MSEKEYIKEGEGNRDRGKIESLEKKERGCKE